MNTHTHTQTHTNTHIRKINESKRGIRHTPFFSLFFFLYSRVCISFQSIRTRKKKGAGFMPEYFFFFFEYLYVMMMMMHLGCFGREV
jgi:hypothetical protein